MDFDKGFGIGGVNRADKVDEDMAVFEAQQSSGKPQQERGWLWEPCPICETEPSCLLCGFCEDHCDC